MKFITLIIILFASNSLLANINQPYGLFFIQDNEFIEEKKIFEVPTLKTDVDIQVTGLLTTTKVKQYFINPTNSHTEAIYLFPLPDKAVVDKMKIKIGNRYIEGVIKEKIEAEEIYESAKKEGKKTSLVSSSRPNIFKTKLANIAPGEMIIIEISYENKLIQNSGQYNIRIPTTIIHRFDTSLFKKSNEDNIKELPNFIEYDPDIHSPINDSLDYTINPYTININLNAGFDITVPQSNDPIILNKINSSHYKISLKNGTIPSTKDFVISFKPITSNEPYIRLFAQETDQDLYIYGLINPQINLDNLKLNKESSITLIADVSGSMSGSSLRDMKKILLDLINSLPESFELNILAFDDNYTKLFNSPSKLTEKNKNKALKFVENLHSGGGTYMLGPVYDALVDTYTPNLDNQIIVFTDGAVGYETEMMALVHQYIGNKRLHIVGIGNAPNSYLMKGLSKAGRGTFIYVDGYNFIEKSNELLYKINRPIIKNLHLVLPQKHEILPIKFPNVIANEPISFFLKFPNSALKDLTKPIILKGIHFSQPWKITIPVDDIQIGNNIKQLWAKEKIDEMRFKNTIGYLDTTTFKKRATNLALENSIITQFTSLVAVDNQISRRINETLKSYQIEHNRQEGWVDPEIEKISDLFNQSLGNFNLMDVNNLKEIDLNLNPLLRINFVQTSTNKNLLYLFAFILFLISFIFLRLRKKSY